MCIYLRKEKSIKKHLVIILSLLLLIALGGCGDSTADNSVETATNVEESQPEKSEKQAMYEDFVASSVETIEISGLNEVLFSPAPAEFSNDLSAGRYHVGFDIKAGDYIVTTESGSGNFFIYDEDGYPLTNEILCVAGDEDDSFGVSKIKVSLEEGYIIDISGLNNVHFE